MVFRGVFVNAAGVFIAGIVGTLFGKKIPASMADTIFKGVGLCVMVVGISGVTQPGNMLVAILSMSLGAIIGEIIDVDKHLSALGRWVENRFAQKEGSIAESFVTTSILVCVGAMTIVGALESGMRGNPDTYYTKTLLDVVAVTIVASTMGIGCALAGVAVLLYQGGLTLLSGFLAQFLTQPIIDEMAFVGSILILGVGLYMLKIIKVKMANLIFVPFIPILLQKFI